MACAPPAATCWSPVTCGTRSSPVGPDGGWGSTPARTRRPSATTSSWVTSSRCRSPPDGCTCSRRPLTHGRGSGATTASSSTTSNSCSRRWPAETWGCELNVRLVSGPPMRAAPHRPRWKHNMLPSPVFSTAARPHCGHRSSAPTSGLVHHLVLSDGVQARSLVELAQQLVDACHDPAGDGGLVDPAVMVHQRDTGSCPPEPNRRRGAPQSPSWRPDRARLPCLGPQPRSALPDPCHAPHLGAPAPAKERTNNGRFDPTARDDPATCPG